ncbi:AraC family transcriptional regulator [Agarivorans aestuarii]|uniref:AraC family transcriptional regulator n=1 Tax=Agarivorans aestuarii TaxID=1563703 RepID=A0ABU7G8P5_9ALTE|nr:AraC family transcriptional regulator [Agarivorans aestuarii]MEE1675783.1 AraC family transcriptional regulator [Agarivorans aestuarii]
MRDPLSEVVSLLAPYAPEIKLAEASGPFQVQRANLDRLFYCLAITGEVLVSVNDAPPIQLNESDFILIPEAQKAAISSIQPTTTSFIDKPQQTGPGRVWIGEKGGDISTRMIIGHCSFECQDKDMLLSLLPSTMVIRGKDQIAAITSLIKEEVLAPKPAGETITDYLLRILLINAFRSAHLTNNLPSLIRGLADKCVAKALRAIHEQPAYPWSGESLAAEAGMSRSAFFSRFKDTVGMAPLSYLLQWRMAKAKSLLKEGKETVISIALEVGYGSSSSFSSAFLRHEGVSPSAFRGQLIENR